MTKSTVVGLKCEATTFRDITAQTLESLIDFHRVAGIKLFVWDIWLNLLQVNRLADICAIKMTGKNVLGWLSNMWHLRHTRVFAAKVECFNQVTKLLAAPSRDLFRGEWLPMCQGPLLQEHNLAFMGCMLRKHVATAGPWRDDIKW